jgi:glycosyltransferase involved in cell wall biosynthesis
MTTLSVVIPALNEENGITEIMNRVLAVRDDLKKVNVDGLELLVVDDGSTDGTAKVAREIAAANEKVWVISHPQNRGYGAALKTGFEQATGDYVGFLDADGTYPPEFFPELCKAALEGWELVIGSRMAGSETGMPLVRKIGNRFFAGMINLLGRSKITDSASGMRVFKREVLERVSPLPDGLNLTPIMSTRAIHEGIKMLEIPIPYDERTGRSKLNPIRDGSIYVRTITWTVLQYNPVRVLGLIGLGGIAVAGIAILGLIIARLSGITQLSPWGIAALFAGMVSGVVGISVFSLGVTFNYLVSLFYQRPIRRQGLLGRPIFKKPLERNFGWAGLAIIGSGLIISIASLILGIQGWEISRLWLYLLGSAMMILVGVQLVINWVLARILDELSKNHTKSENHYRYHER